MFLETLIQLKQYFNLQKFNIAKNQIFEKKKPARAVKTSSYLDSSDSLFKINDIHAWIGYFMNPDFKETKSAKIFKSFKYLS